MHLNTLITAVCAIPLVAAFPNVQSFETLKRQANARATSLEVDLGYSIYRGDANSSSGVNTFKG
jgi:hypothetical protein